MGNIIKCKRTYMTNPGIKKALERRLQLSSAGKSVTPDGEHTCVGSSNPYPRDNKLMEEAISPTTNPYLAFFLRVRSRRPELRVTRLARVAGRRWQGMNSEQRDKYVRLAARERKRRQAERDSFSSLKTRSKRKCKRRKGISKRSR
ncbi:hypothetical protein QAD02_015741 [Eretmocerus hayati]|uniref:Uncharacterized protein n=1 Tax=Eretmocerus hayati TaxID=131215 RepID=A0ACC2PBJ0_9HYME|nr:hypothetical protein QAD02_015741 [Eretmocerus hayati]